MSIINKWTFATVNEFTENFGYWPSNHAFETDR